MSEDKHKQVVITRIRKETFDTSSFELQSLSTPVTARSGQFLTFVFNNISGAEIRRSYSLSSSPELGEPLKVTVKRVPNGEISRRFLDKFRPGDLLNTVGASGMFVLPGTLEKFETFIFFAAGSGIVPVFSLLKTLMRTSQGKAVLIYSSRNHADAIFLDELKELQRKFSGRFELHLLFSVSPDLSRSRLTPILIEHFLDGYFERLSGILFYVCGPTDYMRMVYYTLLSLGISHNNIRREIFFVQHPATIATPPDVSPRQVVLISGDKQFKFPVKYPQTILKAARTLNIPLSYSCENGQCGTCVATCLEGKVWMSRNEILLDEDIANGKILTCTAYPIEGDVIIKI